MLEFKICSKCGGNSSCFNTCDEIAADDLFRCNKCYRKTLRYEDTPADPNYVPECPTCKADDELLPIPAGTYPAARRFKCKLCLTRFTIYENGAVRADKKEK